MRWRDRRESTNIEDRRGMSGGGKLALGGLGGCGTIVVLLLALLFGADPRQLLEQLPATGGGGAPATRPTNPQEEELRKFVGVVLAETEDAWTDVFQKIGRTYRKPTLVLFTDRVESACGVAGAAVGPFYCPGDEKLYIDLSFFQELRTKLGAPGDFAIAYVVAHEVGHHVQNLLGTMNEVNSARRRLSEGQANQLSVRVELQADFYAGVWAHYARNSGIVEPGDIEEALGAASAVGDDRLQQRGQGYVVPDSFTHGTSAQRAQWFRKGFETGDVKQGDTFSSGGF
ncbi:MAG TPA: neutral zinc metallopeptidase [Pyrinomonadaceae bacterium]|nr:neutral zinc metallopeptidase [Pyrinomonadaceae bacterium]